MRQAATARHVGPDHLSAGPRVARVRLPSGLSLNVAEQGAPGGRTLLLLHGYADSSFSFSRLLPLLPPGWRVIAPDQRGHGASDRPATYALDDFARDALDLLDALGVERATVVGHSMGSFIAPRMALLAPERVAHLVLVGSAATARNAATLELLAEVEALADPVGAEFVRAFQRSTLHRPVPPAFLERIVAEGVKMPARVWKAALAGLLEADLAADLGRIRCPTLVVGGELDTVFSPAEQERLARSIPGATLTISPEIGHDPHWEAPEDFAIDLLAFLAR